MAKTKYGATLKMFLQPNRELTEDRQYRPWLPSPPKLTEYAGDIVNRKEMPICWEWTIDQVNDWLKKTVGLPQYQDCIRQNFINGRRLLLLETLGPQKCGITDFSHIQIITAAIRQLFRVEKPDNNRSIGLPPRYPWTHYLQYRIPTGPSREATTPFQLFQKMGILDKSEPCPFGHWQMIEPGYQTFPYNRFGMIPRKSIHRRVELPRQPRGHSYLKRSKFRQNCFTRIDVK